MNRQTFIDELEALETISRRKAKSSLLAFIRYSFRGAYRVAWHNELISAEVQNWIESSDPYNLMLFTPPRHGKSEIASVHATPWIFGHQPGAQILHSTYSDTFARSWGLKIQNVMRQDEYRQIFPEVRLGSKRKADQRGVETMNEFTIAGHRGIYRAAGVGGGITGRGADFALIDDPVKDRADAESETMRERAKAWFRSTLVTRLMPGGRMLLIMTRWHVDDLAGWLLKEMANNSRAKQWRVVSLPAMAEDHQYRHERDNREDGVALWPESYPIEILSDRRQMLGSYDWNSLYQQRPTMPGGNVIKRHWINTIDAPPSGLSWVRAWDLAVSKKTTADYTASGLMAVDEFGNVYVRGFVRERMSWPETRKMLISLANQEKQYGLDRVGIEEAGQQKGFIDDLFADPAMHNVDFGGYRVDKDKKTRALPWIARAEAGKFFVVNGPGSSQYIDELVSFTGIDDPHDDQVDWTSIAYRMLGLDQNAELEIIGEYEW